MQTKLLLSISFVDALSRLFSYMKFSFMQNFLPISSPISPISIKAFAIVFRLFWWLTYTYASNTSLVVGLLAIVFELPRGEGDGVKFHRFSFSVREKLHIEERWVIEKVRFCKWSPVNLC